MKIGTPLTNHSTKVLLLGSGELGKELTIEFQRLGVEVHACDSYYNAPAMQVANYSHVFDMLDSNKLKENILKICPDYIVPEVEAIATDALQLVESGLFKVVPTARGVSLTMNREGIRRLAAEELGLPTSIYSFASTKQEYDEIMLGWQERVVVKPIMSSSGKGQSVVKTYVDVDKAWNKAQKEGRAGAGKLIIEEFIDFDYEITLLTVRSNGKTSFCEPIGHRQVDGDYIESWQPHPMSKKAKLEAQEIAHKITEALGGNGLFGVELFVKEDKVYFSEVSPRPHDTGLVTLISQDLSEFALHVRAILGLPIPNIVNHGPSASYVIKPEGNSDDIVFNIADNALNGDNTQLRLFGKRSINGKRRLGVALARKDSIEEARAAAKNIVDNIQVELL